MTAPLRLVIVNETRCAFREERVRRLDGGPVRCSEPPVACIALRPTRLTTSAGAPVLEPWVVVCAEHLGGRR